MTMLPESISLNPESSIFPPRLTLSSVMCAQSQAMAGVLSYERGQKQDCNGAQPVYEDSSRLVLQWLKQALLHVLILKCLRRGLTHIRARPSLVNRSNINNITIWKNVFGCLTCDPSRKRSNVSRFCRVINRVWNLEQRFFNRPQPK